MKQISGMIRVAATSPRVHLANPAQNAREIEKALRAADEKGVSLCVFPELCLTGATCGDLFYQDALLEGAKAALRHLRMLKIRTAFVVGLPMEMNGRLYNCAAVCCGGAVVLVPMTSRREKFAPAESAPEFVLLSGEEIPVLYGEAAIFSCGGLVFGVAGEKELLSPFSSAATLCAVGAAVIAHLSAQAETVYSDAHRMEQLAVLSRQLCCAIVHAGAGFGESTMDAVFAGDACVMEMGDLLARAPRFEREGVQCFADVDNARVRFQRRKTSVYDQNMGNLPPYVLDAPRRMGASAGLLRPVNRLPFVPAQEKMDAHCAQILAIQAQGLIRRMTHIGATKLIIGVSGGLDSTLALLVAAHAYDLMGWAREGIYAITMPGLGTSRRTHDNAESLSALLGCTALEIPIGAAVAQHFADIGQDPNQHDVCYENSQARERTQILMDYANKVGGIVLGTGDLSELALGFCTYNGDQMSMYNVNGSIPKTLMRPLVAWISAKLGEEVHRVALDIVNTPVSPELVPGEEEISQKTEELLGSYDLHDFFLWHMMDSGASPKKLYALAEYAFAEQFDAQTILRALDTFVRRFFSQQFKRSAMPDGAGATGVSLSPRGGFVCPSDAQRALWLDEVEQIKQK